MHHRCASHGSNDCLLANPSDNGAQRRTLGAAGTVLVVGAAGTLRRGGWGGRLGYSLGRRMSAVLLQRPPTFFQYNIIIIITRNTVYAYPKCQMTGGRRCVVEQGRESGRLGRAVARGEAASPADLVVRLPEACEGEAASPADLGLRLGGGGGRGRESGGSGVAWAAAEGEAASPADLRVRLGGAAEGKAARPADFGRVRLGVGAGGRGAEAARPSVRQQLCLRVEWVRAAMRQRGRADARTREHEAAGKLLPGHRRRVQTMHV